MDIVPIQPSPIRTQVAYYLTESGDEVTAWKSPWNAPLG